MIRHVIVLDAEIAFNTTVMVHNVFRVKHYSKLLLKEVPKWYIPACHDLNINEICHQNLSNMGTKGNTTTKVFVNILISNFLFFDFIGLFCTCVSAWIKSKTFQCSTETQSNSKSNLTFSFFHCVQVHLRLCVAFRLSRSVDSSIHW